MPQFESEPTLSVKYYESGTYTYDELTLLSALPDASQIEVRWDVNTVYGGAGQTGTAYSVDDLDDAVQQEIKTLTLNTQFTIDPSSDTVTIIPAAIENQAIATSSGTFYYPSTFAISNSQFLEIRRATDITYRVVDFQPGSRLTSENLNLANSQVFNAIQELTEFGFGGQGGSITDIDLSNSSVTDLGDVTFNTGVTGLVQWNSVTQQMENAGSTSGLVPDNEGVSDTDGQVLISSYTVGGPNPVPSFGWDWLTTGEVFTNKAATTSLADVLVLIDLDLQTLDTRTSDMSRPAIPGPTSFGSDLIVFNDLTVGNDLVVAGDVSVAGDLVFNEFWVTNSTDIIGDTSNKITGTGSRSFFDSYDLGANWTASASNQQALDSILFGDTVGAQSAWDERGFVAPRDMIVEISTSITCTNDASSEGFGYWVKNVPNGTGQANADLNPYRVTTTIYDYTSTSYSANSNTQILRLASGDRLDFRLFANTVPVHFYRGSFTIKELKSTTPTTAYTKQSGYSGFPVIP